MPRLARRLSLFIASVVVLAFLLGVVALSPMGTRILLPYFAHRAASGANVTVAIDHVEGAMWGEVRVENITASLHNGTSLSIGRLAFGVDLLPLLTRRVRIAPLHVEDVRLRMPFDRSDSESVTDTASNTAGSRWRFEVADLEVSNGDITLAHAKWIDRVLAQASVDTVVTDTLRLTEVRLGSGRLAFELGAVSSFDVAISGVGSVILPLGLSINELTMTAVASADTVRIEQFALQLPNSRLEADGQMIRSTGHVAASMEVDSLLSDDLGRFVPPEAGGLLASGSASVVIDPDNGGWEVVVSKSSVRDRRMGGRIDGEAHIVGVPQRLWDVLDIDARLDGIATARIPGADTLLPPGAIRGVFRTDGRQDSLNVFADLTLGVRSPRTADSLVLNTQGGVSFDDTVTFDDMRISARMTPGILRRWSDVQYLTEGTAAVEVAIDGPLSHSKLVGSLQRHLEASTFISDTVGFRVEPFLSVAESQRKTPGAMPLIDSLRYRLQYNGAPGAAILTGRLQVRDSLWIFDKIQLGTTGLDLRAISNRAPSTSINLEAIGNMRLVEGTVDRAAFDFVTDSSLVRGRSFVAVAAGNYRPDTWVVDSLSVIGPGYSLKGRGQPDSLGLGAEVTSLSEIWPVVVGALGSQFALDTIPTGTVRINASITGTPSEPRVEFDLRAEQISAAGFAAGLVNAKGHVDRSGGAAVSGNIDSLVGAGRLVDRMSLEVSGNTDSALARIAAQLGDAAVGTVLLHERTGTAHRVTIDSLSLSHLEDVWQARGGAAISANSGELQIDSLILNGPHSRIVAAGGVSRSDSSTLAVTMERIPIAALTSFLLPDTGLSVAGLLDGSFNLEGPLSEPTARLSITTDSTTINGERVADAAADLMISTKGTNLRLVLDEDSTLFATGSLPVRLEAEPFGIAREESGMLELRFLVDGADVSRLRPLLTNMEEPRGEIFADVRLGGTMDQPVVSGAVGLRGGHAYMPSLDVEYDGIEFAATLDGASARVDSLLIPTEEGALQVGGVVNLAPLNDPTLDLTVAARSFEAIHDQQFLTMTATGDLVISGRLRAPRVTGELEADHAVLRFADIIEKDVIDLDNPLFAGVVDTTVLMREGLQPGLMKRMQDSLVLDSLVVTLGSDVWLRSDDANVQLGGEAAVNKEADRYEVYGTFLARRGTYQLALGPAATREFQITGGSVRYFGDPASDANLDIDASHTVRTFRGESMDVYANIGGTIADPKITLSSSLSTRLSDTEIISYLLFGAPSVQVFAGRRGREEQSVFQRSAQQLANFLSGTLERSLTGNLGVPVDYLRINPGDVNRGFSSAEVLVGKQLDLFGQPAFLTASPRLCPGRGLLTLETTGASLETWLSRDWLAAASIDPVRACEINTVGTSSYSIGIDLFWEKH